MLKTTSFFLFLGLFTCSLANAQVYRWVDDKGAVHYGQKAPSGVETTQLQLPTEPTGAGVPAKQDKADRDRLLNSFEQDRRERQHAIEERREKERQQGKACQVMRSRWERYTRAGPLYVLEEDGSRRYLSAAEKDAELARLRQGMEENCDELPTAVSGSTRR